jgi:tRNA A37 threonylcarbamoyladenosine dehydratase
MSERIKQINPNCQVNTIEDFVTTENLTELLAINYDYVIDAIDSVDIKTRLIAHCKRNKMPIITIGGAGGQVDPSQIMITDLSKTYQDPLLAKVKNQLRREFNFPRADITKASKRKFSIDAVFSTEQLRYPNDLGEVCLAKPDTSDGNTKAMRLDCSSGFGATTHVTATFAFFAVGRAIDKLLKRHS